MTVEDRTIFRSVILAAENAPAVFRAGELLNDLGHEVATAESAGDAMALLQRDQTDLLVVDVSNSASNRDFVNRLMEIPEGQRPRQLAIFSDVADSSLRGLRKKITHSKVHIFLKPLHIHGLLQVLRSLDAESPAMSTGV